MPSKLPRVNITVTEEQRALLFELAELQGGSAAGLVRQLLDAATPLLRSSVPLLRQAAEEVEITRQQAQSLLREPLAQLKSMGMLGQLDLIDDTELSGVATVRNAASGASEAERSHPSRSSKTVTG